MNIFTEHKRKAAIFIDTNYYLNPVGKFDTSIQLNFLFSPFYKNNENDTQPLAH
jgi:hypothetical protein